MRPVRNDSNDAFTFGQSSGPRTASPESEKSDNTGFWSALLLHPHRLYVDGLRHIVRSTIVGAKIAAACCLAEATTLLAREPADLLITDIAVEDGDMLQVLPQWKDRSLVNRILVVTSFDEPHILDLLKSAPIDGVLDESAEGAEGLLAAIQRLQSGNRYWSSSLLQKIQQCLSSRSVLRMLTATEKLVLGAIGDGCDDAHAANLLGMTRATVQSFRRDLHKKLGVQHKGELLQKAAEYGFVITTPHGIIRPRFGMMLASRMARSRNATGGL